MGRFKSRVVLVALVGLVAFGADAQARGRRRSAPPVVLPPNYVIVPLTGPIDPARCSISPGAAMIRVNPAGHSFESFARVEVIVRDAQGRSKRDCAVTARFGPQPFYGPVLVTGFTSRRPFNFINNTGDDGRMVLDLAFDETINPLPDDRDVTICANGIPIGTVTLSVMH